MRGRSVFTPLTALALATVFAGCSADIPGARGSVMVRDSAGIEIVENMEQGWGAGEEWGLSDAPLLTIGEPEGGEAYRFHDILASRQLSDGRLVVADRGASEIRFFDPDGRFIASAGAGCDGPGELGSMDRVWWLPGDTTVVSGLHGFAVHDPEGDVVRTIELREADIGAQAQPVAQLDDGTVLGMVGVGTPRSSEPEAVIRDTLHFHRWAPDGAYAGPLTSFPAARVAVIGSSSGHVISRRLPFSANPALGIAGDAFILTGSADPELEVWSRDGVRRRLIRWSPRSRTVTLEHITRFRDHLFESMTSPDARRALDRLLSEVPIPERFPATGEATAILVDPEGYLWAEAYRLPWQDDSAWFVFAPDGEWLGSVPMPDGFELHQVGADFVVGRWQDGQGAEYVRVYGLGRG